MPLSVCWTIMLLVKTCNRSFYIVILNTHRNSCFTFKIKMKQKVLYFISTAFFASGVSVKLHKTCSVYTLRKNIFIHKYIQETTRILKLEKCRHYWILISDQSQIRQPYYLTKLRAQWQRDFYCLKSFLIISCIQSNKTFTNFPNALLTNWSCKRTKYCRLTKPGLREKLAFL